MIYYHKKIIFIY